MASIVPALNAESFAGSLDSSSTNIETSSADFAKTFRPSLNASLADRRADASALATPTAGADVSMA